jgi:hypothetical protein
MIGGGLDTVGLVGGAGAGDGLGSAAGGGLGCAAGDGLAVGGGPGFGDPEG